MSKSNCLWCKRPGSTSSFLAKLNLITHSMQCDFRSFLFSAQIHKLICFSMKNDAMFDSQKSHGIRPAPLIFHCRSRLYLFQLCVALTSNFQWCPSQLVHFCAHLSGGNRVKHPKFRVRVRPPRPRCQTWRANTPIASPMALAPQIGMCVSQPRPQWHAQT